MIKKNRLACVSSVVALFNADRVVLTVDSKCHALSFHEFDINSVEVQNFIRDVELFM